MPASPTPAHSRASRRLPLRFSLRVLLIAFTAFAIGFPVWYRWPYTEEELLYPNRKGQPDKSQASNGRVVMTWQRQWGGGRQKTGGEWTYRDGELRSFYTFRNGERHGPFTVHSGNGSRVVGQHSNGNLDGELRRFANEELREVSTYRNDRANGPYQRYVQGRIQETGQYADDRKDGTWIKFDEAGNETARVTYRYDPEQRTQEVTRDGSTVRVTFDDRGRPTETRLNGEVVGDRLAQLQATGQIDSQRIANHLVELTEVEFVTTPVKDAFVFMSEKHEFPLVLDPLHVDPKITITEQLSEIPLSSALAVLTVPHGLACDCRYGLLWITSAEDAKAWRDPTGVAEIQPPPGSQLARAWNSAAEIGAKEMPLAEAVANTAQRWAIELDVSAIKADGEGQATYPVTLTLKGMPFRDVLAMLLYHARCRCELRGDTLVILPPEGK